jgi:hypothetical protein
MHFSMKCGTVLAACMNIDLPVDQITTLILATSAQLASARGFNPTPIQRGSSDSKHEREASSYLMPVPPSS